MVTGDKSVLYVVFVSFNEFLETLDCTAAGKILIMIDILLINILKY